MGGVGGVGGVGGMSCVVDTGVDDTAMIFIVGSIYLYTPGEFLTCFLLLLHSREAVSKNS